MMSMIKAAEEVGATPCAAPVPTFEDDDFVPRESWVSNNKNYTIWEVLLLFIFSFHPFFYYSFLFFLASSFRFFIRCSSSRLVTFILLFLVLMILQHDFNFFTSSGEYKVYDILVRASPFQPTADLVQIWELEPVPGHSGNY